MPYFSPFSKLHSPKLRFAFIGIISLLGSSLLLAQDDATKPTPSPTPTGKHSKHAPKVKAPPTDDSSSSGDDSQDGPGFDGVAYVDKKLNSLITVQKVNNELSPMKLLTVYVDIQNKTRKPLELQVQTMYEDTSKNLVSSDDSWVEFPLKPHEVQEYCSVALTQDARSYLVRIRMEPTDANANSGPGNGEGIPVATPTPTPTPMDAGSGSPTPTPPVASETPTPQPTPKPVPHHKAKLVDPYTLP